MTDAPAPDDYRPFRALAWWLVGLLLLNLALHVSLSGLDLLVALRYPALLDPSTQPSGPTELALVLSVVLVGLAYVAAFVVCVVLFCVWVYRANRNARALGAEGMEYTPGLAVGWFFVPLFNLFKPYFAVREIYQASDPDAGIAEEPGAALSTHWSNAPVAPQLKLWWLAWILSNLLDSASLRFSLNGADALSAWLSVIGAALVTPCTLLAIWMILEIRDRQARRAERVAELAAPPPGAPGGDVPRLRERLGQRPFSSRKHLTREPYSASRIAPTWSTPGATQKLLGPGWASYTRRTTGSGIRGSAPSAIASRGASIRAAAATTSTSSASKPARHSAAAIAIGIKGTQRGIPKSSRAWCSMEPRYVS